MRSPGLGGQRRAGARRPGGGQRACRRDGGLRVAEEEETRVTIGDPKMGIGVKGNGPQIGTNMVPKRPQVVPK